MMTNKPIKWHDEARRSEYAWEAYRVAKRVLIDIMSHAVEGETKMALLAAHGVIDACEALSVAQDEIDEHTKDEPESPAAPEAGSGE